ncbi:NINE protein [Phytohabitans sp. ZYX-F-186]|uniref:NINE protein n=1 Tax=Phytohabitans maris TaxID=3071409 RepID=A0ABU0ZLU1_9ACTN|nr:NINE protein [Phytohabitans sp. ZYX-F-186]MDQ7907943.1 NINE protein [Phytohabitans sp. ZYX-F-186]
MSGPFPPRPGQTQPGQNQGPVFGSPFPGPAGYPLSAYPQSPAVPYSPAVSPPAAPFGLDPLTGLPLSDKSRTVAGLLQIFLGGFAVGRFYTGHVGLALGQLAAVWVPALTLCCIGTLFSFIGGFLLWFFMPLGTIWPLVDGIVLLARGGTDAQGRVLRS